MNLLYSQNVNNARGNTIQNSQFVIVLDYSQFVMYSVVEVVVMRIKEIREKKGILQKDLAARLGIANNTFSQYENGKREPDVETLKRIAEALGVSLDELVGVEGQKKEEPAALAGGELKNAVIFSRDGKMVKKTYSPEKWKTIVEMLDAIPEDDRPL